MRFSEHEMTTALTGTAKAALAAQPLRGRKVRRGQDVEEAWAALTRFQRFTMLDGLGTQVLPVLVALPDVEVAHGERATYDDETVTQVVEQLLDDGSGLGKVRRAVTVKSRVALVQLALSHVPLRRDPDTFVVPDTLEDE